MSERPNVDQDGATGVPKPDHAAIRTHVEMIHELAKGAGVDGILTFTRIDAANDTKTERFSIGDVTYFNCEDTPLNRAFMRKTMIGMVARARVPGIKFDTITVLESPEGFNKSTAWRVLAGDENYSDERILGSNAREAQEQLSSIWIHENADLAGLKKTEVESVKAYASRMVDIARPAFGHFVVKQPRHSIEVGSTNSKKYLQSQTGNRRFWPLEVKEAIDIEKLKRD
jgi:predicted P-loop ATPase